MSQIKSIEKLPQEARDLVEVGLRADQVKRESTLSYYIGLGKFTESQKKRIRTKHEKRNMEIPDKG
ncbi:MAG: hypothetical protein IPL26_11600 [Leptospiraceae bacterium]|nr:hypothetical protein [Leptospiraceae bacterium]